MWRHNELVSVLIPCYRAARWIADAIDSCLSQTYEDIEIIVVDDGSDDNSVEVVKRYGDKVVLCVQEHNGANCARNCAIALSSGAFVQFLDADDYLLPNKIANQVTCLQESGKDVVYGDWRYQFHESDGSVWLGAVDISGEQEDILCSLLSGWWVAPNSLLFRRSAVDRTDGWDEALEAAQDRDFFLSVVMGGASVIYQSSCDSIYRRHGNTSISQSSRERWLLNHKLVCEKAERRLSAEKRLTPEYRSALARSYFFLARDYYSRDRQAAIQLHDKVQVLEPAFRPSHSKVYDFLYQAFGFETAENSALAARRLRTPRP